MNHSPTPRHRGRAAFSLVELMVALGLGLVTLLVAASGFRVASASYVVSARLATENALMRAGFVMAHEQTDFWTDYDDPSDSARQKLRGGGSGTGMTFTPFTTSWPRAGSVDGEDGVGWDARDTAWAAANPRTWYRGNMAEKTSTDLRFGRYAVLADRSPALAAGDFKTVDIAAVNAQNQPTTIAIGYGALTVGHSWSYGQVSGLLAGLGYYGACDYLPANALYHYYAKSGVEGGTSNGNVPKWLDGNGTSFSNSDGLKLIAGGKYTETYNSSFFVPNPLSPLVAANLSGWCRKYLYTGYSNKVGDMATFLQITCLPQSALPVRPSAWPDLKVSVAHFIKNARHVALSRVRWTSPLTGQVCELTWSLFGTTLRGARQQRSATATGGWVRWDNAGTVDCPALDHQADPMHADGQVHQLVAAGPTLDAY